MDGSAAAATGSAHRRIRACRRLAPAILGIMILSCGSRPKGRLQSLTQISTWLQQAVPIEFGPRFRHTSTCAQLDRLSPHAPNMDIGTVESSTMLHGDSVCTLASRSAKRVVQSSSHPK